MNKLQSQLNEILSDVGKVVRSVNLMISLIIITLFSYNIYLYVTIFDNIMELK